MPQLFSNFNITFIVILVLNFLIFGLAIALILSPKLRGKMLSNQVKSIKHMTDYSKEDLKDINKNIKEVEVASKKEILDKYEEDLKDINLREANIDAIAIETKTRAIKKGLKEEKRYCKYCGKKIDSDSIFCASCGKEL